MFRTVAGAVLTMACWASSGRAQQQPVQAVQRFEVGGQFKNVGFSPCDYAAGCSVGPPHAAFGAGVSVNFTEHFAFDSTFNVIVPRAAAPNTFQDGSVAGGRGLEFLAGPRAEVRAGKIGIYVNARGGFLNWSRVAKEFVFNPSTGDPGIRFGGDFFPAVGANVGFEYAPRARVHLRLEAGDQYIDYGQARYLAGLTGSQATPTEWAANAVLTAGAYVGVGRAAGRGVRPFEASAPHRFFDRTNLTLLGISVAAQVPDIVSTQRFLRRGVVEQNALARPFVDQGYPGAIGIAVILNGAQTAIMYALHRSGHHRLERALPILVAIPSAYAGYRNFSSE